MVMLNDSWFCAEGERDARAVIIRGRHEVGQMIDRESHQCLLRIAWQYQVTDPSGLPSKRVADQMAHFEDALMQHMERDSISICFCVYTHNGLREWMWYTSDQKAACDRVNAALSGHEPYPVELTSEDDPEWLEYDSLMRGVDLA